MTTTAWRLAKQKYDKNEAFSGRGAEKYGGRWNFEGERAVYCAEHLSLATLEKRVNTGPEGANLLYNAYEILISSDDLINQKALDELPENWREMPHPIETKEIGSEWIRGEESLVLKIPSVVVPIEYSMILNPNHPHWGELDIEEPIEFSFDPRLWNSQLE